MVKQQTTKQTKYRSFARYARRSHMETGLAKPGGKTCSLSRSVIKLQAY